MHGLDTSNVSSRAKWNLSLTVHLADDAHYIDSLQGAAKKYMSMYSESSKKKLKTNWLVFIKASRKLIFVSK